MRRRRGPRHGDAARAAAGALLLSLLAACAELRPDLNEVYHGASARPRRPVIIVPGVFGSRLKDSRTGEVVWGRFANLLTSRFKLALNPARAERADLLDLPIDSADPADNRDHLVAYDLFDGVAGRGFYRRIVQTLTHVAGYRFGDIADPRPGEDCFAFYYDWRRDVVENAALLGEAIERVRAVSRDPNTRVDLIGHSLGGIIARYYLLYGGRDVLGGAAPAPDGRGARRVDTLVMIGVPNEGSLQALLAHNHGVRIVRPLPPEAIFTMPSTYQSLPHPDLGAFIDPWGRRLDLDLYDASTWEAQGWSAFDPRRLEKLRGELVGEFGRREGESRYAKRLEAMRAFLASALLRARRLHEALDRRLPEPDPVRHFAFGGDCTPTPARAMILPDEQGRPRTLDRLEDVPGRLASAEIQRLMSEPGDGSVTRASLLAGSRAGDPSAGIRIDYTLFLCDTHRNLTENITFQDNLLQFLLYGR